jgi:hypothetical protein
MRLHEKFILDYLYGTKVRGKFASEKIPQLRMRIQNDLYVVLAVKAWFDYGIPPCYSDKNPCSCTAARWFRHTRQFHKATHAGDDGELRVRLCEQDCERFAERARALANQDDEGFGEGF